MGERLAETTPRVRDRKVLREAALKITLRGKGLSRVSLAPGRPARGRVKKLALIWLLLARPAPYIISIPATIETLAR